MRFHWFSVTIVMEVDGMKIGIPKEIKITKTELVCHRVHALVEQGHTVLVEKDLWFRFIL